MRISDLSSDVCSSDLLVAAKFFAGPLRVQDLGSALGQPGDSHLQAVVDEVDIGARSIVAIHDALRDQSRRQMLFMRRLGRLAWSGVARAYDHTREQQGADARGWQARQEIGRGSCGGRGRTYGEN